MTNLDQVCSTIHAVLMPYGDITADQVNDICDIITGKKRAVTNAESTEPPMSCGEVARLLRVSKQTVHYHARHGRIRKVFIKGSTRARGFLASDVRAILNGEVK